MGTFRRVLAATDFSEASRGAIALAAALARDCDAELTVVHVCEVPGFVETGPIPYDLVTPVAQAAQVRLDDVLRAVREVLPGAQGLVKIGVAWEKILEVVQETRADLVVLGTHGRRGFAHAILGSVAERVVRLSPVAVLTVRGARDEG